VISGGEPTLNAQIPEFFARVKALGLFTGLETNGTNPQMITQMLEQDLVDYIAIDVKAPLEWEAYRGAAGLPQEKEGMLEDVKQTLQRLESAGVEIELRCTMVPRIHTPKDVLRLAEQLKGYRNFVLQQFIPERALDPQLRDQLPFSAEVLTQLHGQISGLFSRCEVRGI
jgi:pyruvate formate lyase activating enzyme